MNSLISTDIPLVRGAYAIREQWKIIFWNVRDFSASFLPYMDEISSIYILTHILYNSMKHHDGGT
jgi:hypothetical protein